MTSCDLLHPERDDLSSHILEGDDGTLIPLTETGVFHIEHLRLNRPALLAHRREARLLEKARQTQSALLERLAELNNQLQVLSNQLRQFETDAISE